MKAIKVLPFLIIPFVFTNCKREPKLPKAKVVKYTGYVFDSNRKPLSNVKLYVGESPVHGEETFKEFSAYKTTKEFVTDSLGK